MAVEEPWDPDLILRVMDSSRVSSRALTVMSRKLVRSFFVSFFFFSCCILLSISVWGLKMFLMWMVIGEGLVQGYIMLILIRFLFLHLHVVVL